MTRFLTDERFYDAFVVLIAFIGTQAYFATHAIPGAISLITYLAWFDSIEQGAGVLVGSSLIAPTLYLLGAFVVFKIRGGV